MKFKIKVMTSFQYFPKDLGKKYDPKPCYEFEVSDCNTVADICSKLSKMIKMKNLECVAVFYKEGFNVGKQLECDDKIDRGATLYAFITCYDIVHKDFKSKVDMLGDVFKPQ